MIAILKREWKSYFQNITGWLFIAAVLALYGLYFLAYNLRAGYPYVSYTLSAISFIMLIAVPILTMRSMAEERHSRTDQLVLTAPVSLGKMIFGKFLAMVGVFTVAVAVIAVTPLVLAAFGTVPMGENYVAVLGFWLYGCTCIAVGMLASALTESQVIAAVVAFAFLFLGYMMNSITGLIGDHLITKVLGAYDLYTPLQSFMSGCLDLTGVVYFVSVTALCLFLTCQCVQKRRWSMTTKKLTRKQRILVATTLFGMFFGAGNLIFPVHLGQMAGSNVIPAIIGFIITAVGIPIFGVAAIGVTHSDGLQTLSGKVGKGYGIFFTCLLYLTIGPLFAIPRCATVSFTTGISPMLPEAAQPLALLLFSAVFFAFVLFFSLRPGKITVWIGKIINPVFLLFLAVLVIAALLKPGASISDVAPTEPYATKTSAFFSSFIEGYGTMDAIAGLAFGIVVIDVIRRMGVDNDDAVAVDVLGSGVLTGLLMAVIYVVTILMGTQSRGLFEISDNGGIALTQIAGHYFGGVGQIILAVTITFACLKTSIGLVTSCSETFVKMTHGKISYKLWAILFTLFSFAVSNVGLSAIIEYSIPVLMLIYPPATALIILAFAGKLFRHDRAVYLSTMIFTWAAAIFDFFKTLPAGVRTALRLDAPVELAKRYLPLFDLNLGWLLPAVAGFVIGMAIHLSRRGRAK